MTLLQFYSKLISSLLFVHYIKFSQSLSQSCSGDILTQHCVCYPNKIQCKKAITSNGRTDCFWHSLYGCISIAHEPTLDPTTEPTLEPVSGPLSHTNPITNKPIHITTTATPSIAPTSYPTYSHISPTLMPAYNIISALQCGSIIDGATDEIYHIHWYALCLETTTDLFIDSCGSVYDTWLYFRNNQDVEMRIDCDDCGDCNLQTQLHIFNVKQGNYTVGVGGYRGHYGLYTLKITCTPHGNHTTLKPTSHPTQTPSKTPKSLPTNTPSLLPSNTPTSHPILKATHFPTDEPSNNPTNNPTYVPTVNTRNPSIDAPAKPTVEPTYEPTVLPTPVPTPRPTPKPSVNPTVSPTKLPTVKPAELPVDPTEVIETTSITHLFQSTLTDTAMNDVWRVNVGSGTMNSFEIALIVALLMVSIVVGVMFALKYVNHRTYALQHEKVNADENGSEDSAEEYLQYLHGKTNSIDIEQILQRAKTSLIHVTLDENNDVFVE